MTNLFVIQQFLRLWTNCECFILWYTDKEESWMKLAKNTEPLVWELEQQLAFKTMVNTFMAAPGLG
jgi:hypothetical protein